MSKLGFPGLSKPRKSITVSNASMVRTRELVPGQRLPLLIEPAMDRVSLSPWASAHKDEIEGYVDRHGGVLFRGFDLETVEDFNRFVDTVSSGSLRYTERTSPRSQVSGNIYTSTDYPNDHPIYLHTEQSYNLVFPQWIFFFCVTPAAEQGETPIADCRKVLERIDPAIRERLETEGYLYVRNFHEGMGLSWRDAFQTADKAAVESYCRENDIECEWKDDGRLQTRQRRRVVATHPRTGEKSWFNHLTFFHVSTLVPSVQESLLGAYPEDELPNNTFWGDGTPFAPEVLENLRGAYEAEELTFPWQKGDLLMLDNMLTAHGRRPFHGERKVVVGMAEPTAWADV